MILFILFNKKGSVFMYDSPIHIYEQPFASNYNEIIQKMVEEQDNQKVNYTMEEVRKIGIVVDKDELIKALRYDRWQYEKGYAEGYADGKRDSEKESVWYFDEDNRIRCFNCDEESYIQNPKLNRECYCSICGCKMRKDILPGKVAL
jgi:hypothetical protein